MKNTWSLLGSSSFNKESFKSWNTGSVWDIGNNARHPYWGQEWAVYTFKRRSTLLEQFWRISLYVTNDDAIAKLYVTNRWKWSHSAKLWRHQINFLTVHE